jgi:hypothetical protein
MTTPYRFGIERFEWKKDVHVLVSTLPALGFKTFEEVPQDILIVGKTRNIWFARLKITTSISSDVVYAEYMPVVRGKTPHKTYSDIALVIKET